MPRSIREMDETYRRTYRRLTVGILIIYGVVLLAAGVTLFGYPPAIAWVSEAVQAEFAGTDTPPAPDPADIAVPPQSIRTVKAE